MKKKVIILLVGIMILSLTACGGTPSEEKIMAALEDGTITVDDAMEKGWIDDAWIDAHYQKVEAKTKIYLFEPFETTYLDGSAASSSIINGKMCLVFFDTTKEDTMDKLSVYQEASDALTEKGVPILGIVLDSDLEAAREKLNKVNFPIIVYNDKMEASLSAYGEMFDTGVISVFTKEGGFYSAWQVNTTTESLLDFAEGLSDEE